MKIWIIKHKGKNWFGNMDMSYSVTIDKKVFWTQLCFYRKGDALSYMKEKKYHDFFEVVGCELPETENDNRKR